MIPEIEDKDFRPIIQAAIDYMEHLHSEDACDDTISDYESPIFEAAIEAVYGKKAWDYINKKIDEIGEKD